MPETQNRDLPAFNTIPGLLLTLTAMSGELPPTLIDRLPGAESYRKYAVKRLKRDNLLRTFNRNGVRGLRLTAAAKSLLMERWPDLFSIYLTGHSETNQLKSEVTRRLRLHRMAEVLTTMFNAEVSVLPWEKPALFRPTMPSGLTSIKRPSYYSSREVKELGADAVMIRGSRMTGVFLTDADVYAVYNTGAGQMMWEYNAERRVKALLEMTICQERLPKQYGWADKSAIMFGADMEQMPPLLGVGDDARHNFFVLDSCFEHFFYLTSDFHGEVILQLLCYPNKRAALNKILGKGCGPARPYGAVENDAMDGDEPVLFGYTCDLPRIYRFNSSLKNDCGKGTLYCFDFQEDVMRRICYPGVTIKRIKFDVYERSVFRSQESS